MSAISHFFRSAYCAIHRILLIYGVRRRKPQIAGFRSQRMCPSCGLITPRLRTGCLECGKSFL
jgi:hypothetical protein